MSFTIIKQTSFPRKLFGALRVAVFNINFLAITAYVGKNESNKSCRHTNAFGAKWFILLTCLVLK